MTLSQQLMQLKIRVENAVSCFSNGTPVLVGDDGKRENEVDVVFHASFATKELVNLALTHAKGLLCVALNHSIADKLGFYTAPRFPGGVSHTNFTLSVDAKNNITSGISASDRAHTIRLMASPEAQASDFITPGHVFPLRAVEGGLMARAGHTEALYELCALSNLSCAGALCEVLDENGDPIPAFSIHQSPIFSPFPFISTIDLLWHKVFFQKSDEKLFENKENEENKYISLNSTEDFVRLPCAIEFNSLSFHPKKLRLVLNEGFSSVDNGVSKNDCCAEIVLFSFENLKQPCSKDLNDFCDLSEKVGLKNTKNNVKRVVTLMRAVTFVGNKMKVNLTAELLKEIQWPVEGDLDVILGCLN